MQWNVVEVMASELESRKLQTIQRQQLIRFARDAAIAHASFRKRNLFSLLGRVLIVERMSALRRSDAPILADRGD